MNTFDLSNRVYGLTAGFIAAIIIFMIFIGWTVSSGYSQYDQVSVEGDASIQLAPDVAYVNFGIVTEEEESSEALNENNEITNSVLDAIFDLGINEENVRTYNYYLYPSYDWIDDEYQETGYEAGQYIEVTVKDFDLIGDLIANTSEAGANRFNGVNFELEEYEAELEAAREEAISEARAKADAIAESSGAKIGKLTSYYEYTDDYDYGKGGYGDVAYSESEMLVSTPTFQPGEEEITLTVSLTFKLK